MRYFIGLDLGQARDYSALAVLGGERPAPGQRAGYECRHLHRWTLGTPYPQIAGDVVELLAKDPLPGSSLVVDRTGVGRAVVDVLVDAIRTASARCRFIGVTITAGHNATQDEDGKGWHVPKKDLVAAVQAALSGARLKIAATLPLAKTLVAELNSFKAKITTAGNETFEAWRERDHDDLVLAVALAAWAGEKAFPRGGQWAAADSPADDDRRKGRCLASQAPAGVFND